MCSDRRAVAAARQGACAAARRDRGIDGLTEVNGPLEDRRGGPPASGRPSGPGRAPRPAAGRPGRVETPQKVAYLSPDRGAWYAWSAMPSLDRAAIDPDADRVVRKLTRAGYKAYLVGGCVRDLLVQRTPKDFDVATSATPNEIRATFRNSRIIGRRFRLAHVFFGSKIIETATFRANPREEDEHDLLIRRDNVF